MFEVHFVVVAAITRIFAFDLNIRNASGAKFHFWNQHAQLSNIDQH
jgi:hypothetical protein